MVLRRPEVTRPWDPVSVVRIPDNRGTVWMGTKRDNQQWASALYAPGPLEDPVGLPSPQQALEVADAVIFGQVVDFQ